MLPVIAVILIALALVFVLLMRLFMQRRRDMLFMSQHRHTVTGTVTEVLPSRAGGSERVRIRYTADGKEYTHDCYTRPEKYRPDQTVEMIVHPEKPKLAYPLSRFRPLRKGELRLMAVFCAGIYLFVVLLVLSNVYDSLGRVMDHIEMPLMLLVGWGNYWTEYRLARRGVRGTGTVVYAVRDDKTVRAAAEFDAGGLTCETRVMRLPVKYCKRTYTPGEQIGVLYQADNPDEAILEDDTRRERLMRIAVIAESIVLTVIWALMLFG